MGAGYDYREEAEHDSWEAVLAAVEADVRRTEELVRPAAPSPASSLAPAEIMLPVADVLTEPPPLPPLDRMPPVPLELVERITALRGRIEELRGELERCLAEARQQSEAITARRPIASLTAERPQFVDRRA